MTQNQNLTPVPLPAWLRIERVPDQFLAHIQSAVQYNGTEDIVKLVRPLIERSEVEIAIAVMLDAHAQVIGQYEVSRGTPEQCIMDPRGVFRIAVASGAAALILVHNHPTDDVTPSDADIQTTHRLRACGDYLGIEVIDHIVVGPSKWHSLRFGKEGYRREAWQGFSEGFQVMQAQEMFKRPVESLDAVAGEVFALPPVQKAALHVGLHVRKHRRKDQPPEVKYDGGWRRLMADRGNYIYIEWGAKSTPYGKVVPKEACA